MLCCRKQDTDNPDLTVQLDVFEQWKTNDDEQLTAPDGVDLNDPLNVFHAVFKQVGTISTPSSSRSVHLPCRLQAGRYTFHTVFKQVGTPSTPSSNRSVLLSSARLQRRRRQAGRWTSLHMAS